MTLNYHVLLTATLALAARLVMGDPTNTGLNLAIDSHIHFGRQLYQTVGSSNSNMVMSPLSAQLALEMARAGARGRTAQQISTALYTQQGAGQSNYGQLLELMQNQNDTVVRIANRAYAAKNVKLNPDFLRNIRDTLNADAINIDFNSPTTAANEINRWIEVITENKIRNMVNPDSLSTDTSVLLVNALYFKASWENKFDWVLDRPFHASSTKTINTPFMTMIAPYNSDIRLVELPDLSARLLNLPYKGKNFRFMILLPNKGTTLETLERSMSTRDIGELQQLTQDEWHIRVYVPEIALDILIDLNNPFKQMGMYDMFSYINSDFSGMTTDGSRLFISNVLQKTYLKIDKEGTEAASATSIEFAALSGMLEPSTVFDANRPFLFYLVHRTADHRGTVLFSGRFVSP